MMTRTTVVLAVVLVVLAARPASAQIGVYNQPAQPFAQPPVSPYLNLLRGGPPAVNYYGLVRPQIETNRFIQQQQLLTAQEQVNPTAVVVTTVTGHPTSFMSYRRYFLTQGSGALPTTGPQTVTGGASVTTMPNQNLQRLGLPGR